MYSKELRGIIESMLSVKVNKRPTINSILKKSFIIQKVADYIIKTILNANLEDKTSEIGNSQIDILKEQALKLGISDYIEETIKVKSQKNIQIPMESSLMNFFTKSELDENTFRDTDSKDDSLVSLFKNQINKLRANFITYGGIKLFNDLENYCGINSKTRVDKETEEYYTTNMGQTNLTLLKMYNQILIYKSKLNKY